MTALGIDTSNYTTSAALYDAASDKASCSAKALPVKDGGLGLRQSDALFHHVRHLPEVMAGLDLPDTLSAVGASVRPRDADGSYMPCFMAGESAARMLADAVRAPFYAFSHQRGHLAAAAWSSGHMELMGREFLAWHVSGGTTELLRVIPGFHARLIGGTSDLCAGQLIDRVGVMLGLPFPAGPALEELALKSVKPLSAQVRLDGLRFSLSGMQNKAAAYLEAGEPPESVARLTIDVILDCVARATEAALREYPGLPVLCAGGVMSNGIIRRALEPMAYFARPEFSRDNALGTAILAANADNLC